MPAVYGYRAAALVLGMSEDTLARHRRQFCDATKIPWWRNEDAVRDWYEALIAPPAPPERKPRRPASRRVTGEAVDFDALRAELLGSSR